MDIYSSELEWLHFIDANSSPVDFLSCPMEARKIGDKTTISKSLTFSNKIGYSAALQSHHYDMSLENLKFKVQDDFVLRKITYSPL